MSSQHQCVDTFVNVACQTANKFFQSDKGVGPSGELPTYECHGTNSAQLDRKPLSGYPPRCGVEKPSRTTKYGIRIEDTSDIVLYNSEFPEGRADVFLDLIMPPTPGSSEKCSILKVVGYYPGR